MAEVRVEPYSYVPDCMDNSHRLKSYLPMA
jgi:hypothetical protein